MTRNTESIHDDIIPAHTSQRAAGYCRRRRQIVSVTSPKSATVELGSDCAECPLRRHPDTGLQLEGRECPMDGTVTRNYLRQCLQLTEGGPLQVHHSGNRSRGTGGVGGERRAHRSRRN